MTDSAPHSWYYDSPATLTGALQHGLGRGATRALRDSAGPAAVFACVERDHRWFWGSDARAVYLARLIRDLAMPVPPVLALLREYPPGDDDNAFENTLEVLEVLGRSGNGSAVDGLRAYVRDGPRWTEVLQVIAGAWPPELWDDLLPVAKDRLRERDGADDLRESEGAVDAVLWRSRPWLDWAVEDESIAARVEDFKPQPGPPRPLERQSTEDLLAVLSTSGVDQQRSVLRELNRRGPQSALLTIADDLPATELYGPFGHAIRILGHQALALARTWAQPPVHPMVWTAYCVLAAHGDDADLPALFEGWDWLDRRARDLCGYDQLATGIARIGGPAAREAVPRLRRAWYSPHTYERATCLRAITVLDPDAAHKLLFEGLWDCEADVRQFSAEHVALDTMTRDRLYYLRDDPMETSEVRVTAAGRLR